MILVCRGRAIAVQFVHLCANVSVKAGELEVEIGAISQMDIGHHLE
jgi:hypothetical protein